MSQSLFQKDLQLSTGFHEAERNAIETQSEKKRKTLLKKRLKGAIKKYTKNLYHHDMFDSAVCFKTCAQIDNKLREITNISGRKEAMKNQIRI